MDRYVREILLFGEEKFNRINQSKVIVFGCGGVGGYVVEALARCGVGTIGVVDYDVVEISNINRQIIALENNVSRKKVDVIKERINAINSKIVVKTYDMFFDENSQIDISQYDYVVDAIDSVKSKVYLAETASKKGLKIISAMSAGNKVDATAFCVEDIYKTTDCPIAKIMRKELKKLDVPSLKVVYSKEKLLRNEKPVASFCPVVGCMGFIIAGEVIKEIINE